MYTVDGVPGDLPPIRLPTTEEEIVALIGPDGRRLVIDARRLRSISETTVAVLAQIGMIMRRRGGEAFLKVAPNGYLLRFLVKQGLDQLLKIELADDGAT